jgi:putative hydrolase of the HAD superfamily
MEKLLKIKVIGFDADDTLWVNEPYYQNAEKLFCKLLVNYLTAENISAELFKTEIDNIERYGYGAKGFTLSMVETALRISNKKISSESIDTIINIGKSLLETPIELLDDIEYLLTHLKNKYRLIVATKGDLIDQQRKLNNSGLLHYFDHIEIMHDKNETEYQKLIKRLEINSDEFLMVGNSLKSDILPVIAIGGHAAYVPYHTTWQHETVNSNVYFGQFSEISKLTELLNVLPINNINNDILDKFIYKKKEFDIEISENSIKPKGLSKFYDIPKDAYKIYIVKDGNKFLYIGITKTYLSSRFTLGFNATIKVGHNGYHGYKWIKDYKGKQLKLIVLSFPNMISKEDKMLIETIEAELAFQVRNEFGRWCEYQNEIHFYNIEDNIDMKIYSEKLFKEICN